jgi:hypothetical protein
MCQLWGADSYLAQGSTRLQLNPLLLGAMPAKGANAVQHQKGSFEWPNGKKSRMK